MRDYGFIQDDGTTVPVAKMSNADLADTLSRGAELHGDESHEAVIERCLVERTIRELGLR